jgi:hypothetical protein
MWRLEKVLTHCMFGCYIFRHSLTGEAYHIPKSLFWKGN